MRRFASTFACLAIVMGAAGAQEQDKCRYRLAAKMPLQYHGRSMNLTMPGKLNDTPAMVLIDTGANSSFLTRLGTDKRRLHLIPTARAAEGVGGITRLYRVFIKNWQIGPISNGERGSLLAIDEMGARPEFDLIAGSDFLLSMDVEFNLAQKEVRFFAPQNCDKTFVGYWGENVLVLPLHFDSDTRQPLVEVELNGVKLTALIDTGAAVSVVTEAAAKRAGVLPAASRGKGRMSGIGQTLVDSQLGKFKSFAISDEKIENPVLHVVPHKRGNFEVVLGTDFLRSHRVLLALSQKLMYFSYVGGTPFDDGTPAYAKWIDREADGGNLSAQYLVARARLDADDEATRKEGLALMVKAAAGGEINALRHMAEEYADQGRHADSVAMLEKVQQLDDSDFHALLRLYVQRIRAGGKAEAAPALQKTMQSFRWPVWPAPVSDYYLGKLTYEQLLREANSEDDIAARRRCEVYYHAAELHDALGQAAQAKALEERRDKECKDL